MRNLALPAFVLLAVSPLVTAPLTAQDEQPLWTKDTSFKGMAEIGIAGSDNSVVKKAFEYVRAFTAAGVAEGEDENWMCRTFLTEHTMQAVPLRMRIYRDPRAKGRWVEPLVHLDYQREIDFGEMFAPMRARALEIDGGYDVRGMHLIGVKRPDGGFRMNFGRDRLWGANPAKNELFTTFYELPFKGPNERLLQRLRQMPIYIQFDARPVMGESSAKEIRALFGPKGGLLSGSITSMGGRPVVDAYSGIGPGEGLVGQYLDRRPGMGVVLGKLGFEPGFLLAADLGKTVPRSLMTLMRGAFAGEPELIEAYLGLLESWDGRLTLVGKGTAAPQELAEKPDLDAHFDKLRRSLQGAVLFGIEDDSAAEIVKNLQAFLSSDKAGQQGVRAEVDGNRKAFSVPGGKRIALGAGKNVVAFGIGNSLAQCCNLRDQSLHGDRNREKPIRQPRKFMMMNGPIKLWVRKDMARHIAVWYRGMRVLFAGGVSRRVAWARRTLEEELLAEDLAASLSWSRRFGTMLRVMF